MSISNAVKSYHLPGNGHLQPYCHEIFQSLRRTRDDVARPRAIGLTSSFGGEGVSTLAANLAIAAAAGGVGKVLLVDANLDHPSQHTIFGFPLAPGLVEFLSGRSPADCAHPVVGASHLALLTAGAPPDAIDGHGDKAFAARIEILKQTCDCVIFDLPPVADAVFPPALLSLLDGVLLVTESERIQRRNLWRTKCALEGAGANILGVVVNKQRQYFPRWLDNILPVRSYYPPRHPR
jgi:capsular exopolysaccharide synthesis family protein